MIKAVTLTQYNNKHAISIANLFKNTRQTEITCDQEEEFNGHNFRKYLFENNKGLVKPSTLGNYMSNIILERLLQVLENLVADF